MKQLAFLVFVILFGCEPQKRSFEEVADYESEMEGWHKKREDRLRSPNGWLNVRGLYWLKEGINSFGSDASNEVVFPEGTIAGKAGFFLLRDTVVTIEVLPDVEVVSGGKPVSSLVIFHPDSTKNKTLESGSLLWFVIKRDDKVGIRLRDFETEKMKEFKGIESYEPNLDWKLSAKLTIPIGKKVEMVNVLGQTYLNPVKGTITFSYNDKVYSLDAIEEDGKLFIIYGDATNSKETYGSGRYLYADMPASGDMVDLDFNKSINPPCAFTEFATCLLPAKGNILPFEVTAGEKDYH